MAGVGRYSSAVDGEEGLDGRERHRLVAVDEWMNSAQGLPIGRRLPRSGRRSSLSAEARGRIHLSIVVENVALQSITRSFIRGLKPGRVRAGRNALERRDLLRVAGGSWATFWATNIL
jgi:hypothetical protein